MKHCKDCQFNESLVYCMLGVLAAIVSLVMLVCSEPDLFLLCGLAFCFIALKCFKKAKM